MSTQTDHGGVPAFQLKHRLSLALEIAELKPEDIAVELGLAATTVRNYLAGRTSPKRAVLVAWALRCGVPIDWLAEGVIPQTPPDDGGSVSGESESACTRSAQVLPLTRPPVDAQVTYWRNVA